MTGPLADIAFQEQLDAEVARETRRLRAELDERSRELSELRKMVGFVTALEQANLAPPKWTRKPTGSGHHGIVVAQLTDTHFDEVVRPEEMHGLNAYDRRIAEMRLRRWTELLRMMVRDYMTTSGTVIDGCTIFATGDIFSGDIHAELKETNEDKLYASVIHWEELLVAAIQALADEFGSLHIAAVVGNHGRDSKKPVYKGRAKSNIEWLLWKAIAGRMSGDQRITFDISEAIDLRLKLYDRTYVLEHGDEAKGGTGVAAALSPMMLRQHRMAVKHLAIGQPMNTLVVGHWHIHLDIPGLFMGGCMKGYDEYAAGKGFAPPAQGAEQYVWIETPERGKTITAPLYLEDRKAEGWG